jgi:hypothetical protein
MEKMLKTEGYTLIFSDPDLILYGSIDGNLCVYMDEAEKFARSFFSEGIASDRKHNLARAKYWLVGILYHERKNSIPEIMKVTGYKHERNVAGIIKKFGPTRNRKEATELAFKKRYGKSMSEVMSQRMEDAWKNNKDLRDKISRTTSDGMKRFWQKRKNNP